MPPISWRSILRVIAVISWIASIAWFYFEPGWEPLIAVLTGTAFFIASFFVSDDHRSIPTSEKTKSAREERNRQRMLKRVKNDWIKDVLKRSLHAEVLIELGLEERRDAVYNQQRMELQLPGHPNPPLPLGVKIVDVFDEMGPTLLIMGEPGSGKTTMLLELARDTIARAEQDPLHEIPVVSNLSSWTDPEQPIADWLVDELNTKYDIQRKIASDWIENDDLILLLDGLDEVSSEHRDACTRAINDFRQKHAGAPLVVCCRGEEYMALTDRLDLKGAVTLRSLTEEQIDNYLDRLEQKGWELTALRTALNDTRIPYELAQTPLMLVIMALTYCEMSVDELQPLSRSGACKHLFDTYVERMFKPRTQRTLPNYPETDPVPDLKQDGRRFSKEKTIHWLSWLANRMSEHGQTVFLIERMQPDWLPTREQRRIVPLCTAVMIGLVGGFFPGLLSGLSFVYSDGILFGLVGGLISWMLCGLLLGVLFVRGNDIRPVQRLCFPWSGLRLWVICAVALLVGLFVAHSSGLFGVLFSALLFMFIIGLLECKILDFRR